MARSEEPDHKTPRAPDAPRARLVVSFVDRNWLWSRFGLGLSLFLAAVIGALALMPLPDGLPERAGLDKIYYFVAYLVLVFPVIVTDTNRWSWAVPAAIVFGGIIELTQPLMGRNADWLDFAASISGVLAGAALAEILHNRMRRSVLGDEPDLRTDLALATEADRLEAMRTELMAELRAVLREELDAAARRESAPLSAPSIAASPAKPDTPRAARPVATAAPPKAPAAAQRARQPLPDADMPLRVAPLRVGESDALRRAKLTLLAKDRRFDPLPEDEGATTRPPHIPPQSGRPEGGASPRH